MPRIQPSYSVSESHACKYECAIPNIVGSHICQSLWCIRRGDIFLDPKSHPIDGTCQVCKRDIFPSLGNVRRDRVDTVELIRLLLSGSIQNSQRSSLTGDGSHFDENPNRTKAKLYQMAMVLRMWLNICSPILRRSGSPISNYIASFTQLSPNTCEESTAGPAGLVTRMRGMQIWKANKMEISGGSGLPMVHARGISLI